MKSTCLLTLSFLLIEGWSINLWHENRNPQFILNETQKHSTLSPIKSEKLKKELSSYIDRVNLISNSGKKPIYFLIFRREKNEDYLTILGQFELPIFTNSSMNDSLELKGFCLFNNQIILIYDRVNTIGYKFYNTEMLVKDTIPFFKENYGSHDVENNVIFPTWVYKIRNHDDIIIKKKTKIAILQ